MLRNIYIGGLADKSFSQCLLNVVVSGENLLTALENDCFVLNIKRLSDPIKEIHFTTLKIFQKENNQFSQGVT